MRSDVSSSSFTVYEARFLPDASSLGSVSEDSGF